MEATKFYEKIAKVQLELKAPKGQYNSFGKYKYRSCEDIVEAVKPILNKEGLILNLNDDLYLIGDRYYIKATAKITDGVNELTSTAYARESFELKGMSDSQVTGTASSYARKYALNGLLAIDDTKDADTDEFARQTKQEPLKQELLNELAELNNGVLPDLDGIATYVKKANKEALTNDDLIKVIERKKKALNNISK